MKNSIEKQAEEVQLIYEGLIDGVLIVDMDTRDILWSNSVISEMLGYSNGELLKKPWMTVNCTNPK